ncbi:hypothetical protein QBC45DRAFT_328750 [Copromyces sp. CBS 386.78]|nr:hypothetical protein QBC45DRAFT_328750 [Copromyces sp. CBS 386.78]
MHLTSSLLFTSAFLAGGINASPATNAYRRQNADMRTIIGDTTQVLTNTTKIRFPDSDGFFGVTERWDVYRPPSYQAAITPTTEADIVSLVKMAKEHNIPFLATGGRHGYGTTLGNCQEGLAIDLSHFKDVKLDKQKETVTIGPGVVFADVFPVVHDAGFQIQTGTCSCVGMIGATIGAGIGRLDGVHGLVIDALESVRMVTANGDIVEASKTKNPELFWGIRGAGANFGIITQATYKMHKNMGDIISFDLIYEPEKNVTLFNTIANMYLPPGLTVETIMSYNQTTEKPTIIISSTYAGGSEAEARRWMQPLLRLNPWYTDIKPIPWKRMSTDTTLGLDKEVCANSQIYDVYGVNLRRHDANTWVKTFNKLAKFWNEQPAAQSSVIVLETWPNQAVVAVPDSQTAYPWRDATTYVMIQMRWDAPGNPVETVADAMGRELRDDYAKTSGYNGLTVYVNYAHGDETPEQIYGRNKLPRLAKLKKQYDPSSVFGFHNPLPTSYP